MNIAHEVTPTQIALYEAAKQRERKRMDMAKAVANEASRGRVVMLLPEPEKPKPPRVELDQNAHVSTYQIWQARYAGQKIRRYINEWCAELDIDANELLSASRKRELTRVRQIIMWEIKTIVKPSISLPEIGRIFGRDHTTVLHAIQKVSAEMGVKYVGLKSRGVADG